MSESQQPTRRRPCISRVRLSERRWAVVGCQRRKGPTTFPLYQNEEKGQASLGTKREQALRLMAIRQERPKLLAFSASGHEGAVNGWTAASEEKRMGFPMELSVR